MLGDVPFFPDSLGDEERHKEILLHTDRYTQAHIDIFSHSLTHIAFTHQCYTSIKTAVWQRSE